MTIKSPSNDRLFNAILQLKTVDDCYRFFEDLCTIKEIQDMSQRLDTAILLDKKENYTNIAEQVGVSTATISRVNKCLQYGTGGYSFILNKLKEEGKI